MCVWGEGRGGGVLNRKQQQCTTWIHISYLQKIFVWDFYGFTIIMYVCQCDHCGMKKTKYENYRAF